MGANNLAAGKLKGQPFQKFAQILDLIGGGLIVDPVHTDLPLFFQGFSSGDIGQNHKLLDQPVTVEALAAANAGDIAGVANYDLSLRQLNFQGTTLHPCLIERLECAK